MVSPHHAEPLILPSQGAEAKREKTGEKRRVIWFVYGLKPLVLFQLPRIFFLSFQQKGASSSSSSEGSVRSKHFLVSLEDARQEEVGTGGCRDLGESPRQLPAPSSTSEAAGSVKSCPCKECKCKILGTLGLCTMKPLSSSHLHGLISYAPCALLTPDQLKIDQAHPLPLFCRALASPSKSSISLAP